MNCVELPYLDREKKRSALGKLLEQPWSMLLDSAGEDLNYNRYDIFCSQPSATLSFNGHETTINNLSSSAISDSVFSGELPEQNPIECLRRLLAHFQPQQTLNQPKLPFKGGWLGYVSYDFGRHLEQLPQLADDDLQLPQVNMGLYQWAMITDHQHRTSCLYNFGLSQPQWQKITDWMMDCLQSAEATIKFELTDNWQSNTSYDKYQQAFETIQDYIFSGDCYQVNFAQRFSAPYKGDIFQAYQKLAMANKAPFSAYLNFSDHQILSVSPERFIESHGNKVTTQPIKGTRPRSIDPIQDKQLAQELVNSEKDRAENLMIVDLLRNDLSRTAARGSVNVSELFGCYRFASVHHLISTIESELDSQYDNFDLLATTLPGGSITGAPKIRAMEIIEELEPVRRNLYCGIIGYIDFNGNMDTNICIRTLIAKDQVLHCWAGGGLVADSELKTEYQETFDKLAKILPILSPQEPTHD